MLGSALVACSARLGLLRSSRMSRGTVATKATPTQQITHRTRFSGRMYDNRAFFGKQPIQQDDDGHIRVPEKTLDAVRKAMLKKHGPSPPRRTEAEPYVPYYRKKTDRFGEAKPDGPMSYRFAKPYTQDELARNQEAFKSWQSHMNERKKLNEQVIGGRKGVGADMKLVGTWNEADGVRFKKGEREIVKKELDPAMNMRDHGFEYDYDEQTFSLNGTKVPQKFDHWIEEPGSVKTPRDLKMMRRIERAKEKAAAKHRAKQMGTANKSTLELEKRHVVTRRMLRVSNLILDELGNALTLLPNYLSRQKVTKYGQNTKYMALPESMLITSGAVHFSKVEISRDLLHAKIFWEAEEHQVPLVERELDRSTAALRHLVTQAVHLKFSPELIFVRETASQVQRETAEIMKKVEVDYNNYLASGDSPYIPTETTSSSTADSARRIDVHIAKPANSDAVVLPIQEKLIRSRWTAKVTQPPAYQTWKAPPMEDEEEVVEEPATTAQPK